MKQETGCYPNCKIMTMELPLAVVLGAHVGSADAAVSQGTRKPQISSFQSTTCRWIYPEESQLYAVGSMTPQD
jgi:hypothetical protein